MQKNNLIANVRVKIGALALCAVMCFVSSSALAQTGTVSLQMKKASIADVFREIEKQSDYRFFYNTSVVSAQRNMDMNVTAQPIAEVLKNLFEGSGINYRVVDNYIVITTRGGNEVEQLQKMIANKGLVITGAVRNSAGEPLIGATVVEIGTTNGTATDIDGRYSIKVTGSSAELSFSYIGFTTVAENVGTRTVIDATLEPGDMTLEEVVVTAMGISRQTKTLTYNVQEIDNSEFTTVKDANFINSLQGKVAGVTINSSASGVGGSSRVVMRGTKSLFGSNDALYVVDGIAMPNLKTEQPNDFYKVPDHGDNDGISHLNPDDIESISILTGPAASALYGNQGANGVILITTKKGTGDGKIRLNVSSNTSFTNPFILPKFQNTYGREDGSYKSWGRKLQTPSSYNPADFFETGYTTSNTVSTSFGSERNNTYFSMGAVNSAGSVPNTKYDRYNISFRNTSNLLDDRLTIDLSASYMIVKDQNMRAQGQYHNPLVPIYLFPPSDDINKYKMYERYDIDRNMQVQYWPYGNQGLGMQNPYWVINRSMFNHARHRYMMSAQVKYNILEWLNITGRAKMDNSEANSTKRFYATSDGIFAGPNGHYMNHTNHTRQIYGDIMLSADKSFFCDDFRLIANLGASITDTQYGLYGYEGNLSKAPNFFHFTNIDFQDSDKTKPTEDIYHDQVQALYGTVQLGYKDMLYLDLTGRIDWPSALHGTDRPYATYPSVGLSAIISEMADLRAAGISFLKARVSYSGVGNPPKRWIAGTPTYPIQSGQIRRNTFQSASWLKPEHTRSFEAGLNAKFFNGKLNLDVTYYNSHTYNQLFTFEPLAGSGYKTMDVNAGDVWNWGIEASLGYRHNFREFSWSSNVTFSMNRNKIIELLPYMVLDDIPVGPWNDIPVSNALSNAYVMKFVEGGTASDIYVKGLRTDSHGNIWVSSTTGQVEVSDNLIKAGHAAPDFNIGWRNSFSYKGFDLGFLIDARIGGIVVSATQSYLDGYGVSQASAEARDKGYVYINGKMPMNPTNYYSVVGGGQTLAPYVYSATNVRLREMSLSYTFPSKWFNDKMGLTLSVTGNNLWMIYNKAPYDPEMVASTDTYFQGFDFFMMPSMRSWGFGVKIQF